MDQPVDADVGGGKGKAFAGGNADHLFDDIDTGDELRYRMFDLETGVHLQEVEIAVGRSTTNSTVPAER